jgi:hypothetical protein
MSSRNIGRGDSAGHRRNRAQQQTSSPAKSTPRAKAVAKSATGTTLANLDRDAGRLAALLEQALAEGHVDALTPAAVQRLMAAICRAYRAQIEAGQDYLPLAGHTALAPTDVMVACGALLRAADLGVFELGVWQSFTGR